MKNEKENYDRKEYLYKANMKQINYSRYFDVYSDNDSTKYEPEKYSVLNSSTKELKLELIINEENHVIEIKTFSNQKISEDSLEKIKSVLSVYYSDSPYIKLLLNGKKVNDINLLIDILSCNTTDDKNVSDIYKIKNEKANNLFLMKDKIHLHLDVNSKTAYIKLPNYYEYTKENASKQLIKCAKDIVDKIGTECKIYAINEAGEIYTTLTLNQLLETEKINFGTEKLYEFNSEGEKSSLKSQEIQTNEILKRLDIHINKELTAREYNEILEKINDIGHNYNVFTLRNENAAKERKYFYEYFKKGYEGLLTEIKTIREETINLEKANIKQELPENQKRLKRIYNS